MYVLGDMKPCMSDLYGSIHTNIYALFILIYTFSLKSIMRNTQE